VVWTLPQGCGFSVLSAPALAEYYPAASKRLSEEGTVYVSFLSDSEGRPSDVSFESGSQVIRLQQAAVNYVKQLRVQVTCKNARYLTKVKFRLNDRGEPEE
jgi:TonB family protein